MTQLILGTAQFGHGYGMMNSEGRLSDELLHEICATAISGGIDLFDTSPLYGDAQERLGRTVPLDRQPEYISKFGLANDGVSDLEQSIQDTFEQLHVKRLHGLMFHRVEDLRDPEAQAACEILRGARADGSIGKIGASIYELSDLEAALNLMPDLDLVQIPANILDRRLIDHPLLTDFHDRGGTVHVRSAYLQGVLLAAPDDIPEKLQELRHPVMSLQKVAGAHGITLVDLLLGFLKHHPSVDAIVVGSLSVGEIQDTLRAWSHAPDVTFSVPQIEASLLDPRKW